MNDISIAKQQGTINWLLIGFAAIVLLCLLPIAGFSLDITSVAITALISAVLVAVANIAIRSSCSFRWSIFFGLCAMAQLFLITAIMTPLTYIAAALKMPMQDDLLGQIDLTLGYRADRYIEFAGSHELVANLLNFGYGMILWSLLGIPVVLAVAKRFERLQQFLFAFMATLVAATVISARVPAYGTYHHWAIDFGRFPRVNAIVYQDYLKDLAQTLDGTRRHLDLLNLQGLVTFPSFHATCSILYFWALQPVRFFGPLATVCNAIMLAATPIVGGHYLIDILAGIALAVIGIHVAVRVSLARAGADWTPHTDKFGFGSRPR